MPYRLFAIAILGQFGALLVAGIIGAVAVPCCDNPFPEVPRWYGFISTPIHFAVLLLPGFLCGFFVTTRPILVGVIAGGAATALWYWLSSFILANLFPARAVGGLGQVDGIIYSLASGVFLADLLVSSLCNAAAAAAGASGGLLARDRAR